MLLGQGGLRSCAEFCLFLIGFSFRFIFKLIYLNGATDLRPFSYYALSQYFTNLSASPFFTFHSCFLQLSVEAVAGHSCFFFSSTTALRENCVMYNLNAYFQNQL
uniref:(northern house mosquito) hypothetical protein n=1 Tax=Culex pipiens TaxID=7175 RepID=A0A8D8J7G1_CULPI